MALSAETLAGVSKKRLRIDNRTHTITVLDGEARLFGRSLPENATATPSEFLSALHPDDVETMLDAFERGVRLGAGETMRLRLRIRHDSGFWMSVRLAITPETTNLAGDVLTALADMESEPLDEAAAPPQ